MNTCTKATPYSVMRFDMDGIHVDVHWKPLDGTLDRPHTYGYLLDNTPAKKKLAQRLADAIDAGVAVTFDGILTDINGKTYVDFDSKVLGRTMNADLKRLGY